jgi:hypothetical protein
MSILIIGVGYAGARVAEKVNQLKMPGVNCAVVVDGLGSDECPSIVKGVDISDNDPINSGGELEYAKKLAEDNLELIKTLIHEGTSKDWSKDS